MAETAWRPSAGRAQRCIGAIKIEDGERLSREAPEAIAALQPVAIRGSELAAFPGASA